MADVAYFPSGWRQVDGTIGSPSALGKITVSEGVRRAQEQQTRRPLRLGYRIRTGSDVIKAIAMCAFSVSTMFLFSLSCLKKAWAADTD